MARLLIFLITLGLVPLALASSVDALLDSALTPTTRLLYIADSYHENPMLKESMRNLIQTVAALDKEYNCLLLETDKKFYQQAIDLYQNGEATWEESVEKTDRVWQELTGRPYSQSKIIFDEAIKHGMKIHAVDWDDTSEKSRQMKQLFDEGFKHGKTESLGPAFQLGVTERNREMAINIAPLLISGLCKKAIMPVGSLHLVTTLDMSSIGVGTQDFQPISDFLPVEIKNKQALVGVYDCIDKANSGEVYTECLRSQQQIAKNPTSNTTITHIPIFLPMPLNTIPVSSGAILTFY